MLKLAGIGLLLLLGNPAWATWTEPQHKFVDSGGGGAGTCSVPTTTCSVTVTSIGAGHLIICSTYLGDTTLTINACTGDSGTWVHCTTCAASGGAGKIDTYYVLSATGGGTSIVCHTATNETISFGCTVRELSTTLTPAVFDNAGTSTASCSSNTCAGVSVSITGSNDVFIQGTTSDASCTAINQSYGNLDSSSVESAASLLNSTNTTAPTWTCTGATAHTGFGAAFKETSGAGACALSIALLGVGCR